MRRSAPPSRLPFARTLAAGALTTLAACAAPGGAGQTPRPTPAPPTAGPPQPAQPSQPAPPPAAAGAVGDGLPADWHLRDRATDGVAGTSATRAVRELLAGRAPQRTVVVAVIDGGVDTAHAALRGALWRDPREAPGTDGDRDGRVGDVHGWNFLGGADGRNVDHERLELTRLAAACRAGQAPPPVPSVGASCPTLVARLDSARQENAAQLQQLTAINTAYQGVIATLAQALGTVPDSVTPARVRGLTPANGGVRQAKERYQYLVAAGVTPRELKEALDDLSGRAQYELNPAFDPRPIVGDSVPGRPYGNADVTGPDAGHGTHVAGIVAALPLAPADSGMRGVVPAGLVRIMPVRAVPNGDERDKDVANAIRYAVDHGAQIVNMSFGKAYSPQKASVDSAVRYAESRGVLLVHAAGNDGSDNDAVGSYPTPTFADGGRATTWIEVGASTPDTARLAAPFSNYGARTVDLFAPGTDIYSTLPGGGYGRNSGTSMAAPVVTGVAALLMSYFPQLTAADVKRILVESSVRFPTLRVTRPGTQERAPFAALSQSGGVVNAYTAVQAALRATGAPATTPATP